MTRDERACPKCRGSLHDLTRPSDRTSALRLIERPTLFARAMRKVLPHAGQRKLGISGFLLLFMFVVTGPFAVLMVTEEELPRALLMTVATIVVVPFILFDWIRVGRTKVAELTRSRRRVPIGLHPDTETTRGEIVLRGRVRALDALASPLEQKPCVAWRLVGRSSTGALDDAWLAPFEIVTDEGTVRVENEGDVAAVVAVDVTNPRAGGELDNETRDFVASRLIEPDDPTLRLGEAMISDGDLVVVYAATERSAATENVAGFRVAARTRISSGAPRIPLRIERQGSDTLR